MPLYEYACKHCEHTFEALVFATPFRVYWLDTVWGTQLAPPSPVARTIAAVALEPTAQPLSGSMK